MTSKEKDALLHYIDVQMISWCETLAPHVTNEGMHNIYDDCYKFLNDLENTMDSLIEIQDIYKQKNH
jgi:hypothetical protein